MITKKTPAPESHKNMVKSIQINAYLSLKVNSGGKGVFVLCLCVQQIQQHCPTNLSVLFGYIIPRFKKKNNK